MCSLSHVVTLGTLTPITSAPWDVAELPFCSWDVQLSLLEELSSWAELSSNHPYVYWMNGLAAADRSAIARIFCQRLYDRKRLGASFFVSQKADHRDASDIIRSIAYQLTERDASFANVLYEELLKPPIITSSRSLQAQITDFITKPGLAIKDNITYFVVVDALDECTPGLRNRRGGEFLPLLVNGVLGLSGRLRLFITIRGDSSSQDMLSQLSSQNRQTVMKLPQWEVTLPDY
jgi:hypothetical protein